MELMSTKQVATELGVSVDRVLGFIASGELTAANVSQGTQRPRWRVKRASLIDFLDARSSCRPRQARTAHSAKPPVMFTK